MTEVHRRRPFHVHLLLLSGSQHPRNNRPWLLDFALEVNAVEFFSVLVSTATIINGHCCNHMRRYYLW